MSNEKKLEAWAKKLLDTGKRNNLISFKDSKNMSADVLLPDTRRLFEKCSADRSFEVFDPKIQEDDELLEEDSNDTSAKDKLSKKDFYNKYASRIKKESQLLVYGQTANPITAVKNIAKRAQAELDETGINVSYLAFGLVSWNENENSTIFYKAPLLLIHVNIVLGTILDPIKIEIADDDVVVNPTFRHLLEGEYKINLPDFEDGDTLDSYYSKVSYIIKRMGWEIIDECKLGIFSFLKINMYQDLLNNAELILANNNIKAILGESVPDLTGFSDMEKPVENELVDLHMVVDADSSQIEAIEMAKTGKSFVLQGPPGTGKSQTITNIIAECLYDGKKVLFVSEKQAALNVVYDKLKKVDLQDFCLEMHSHKANKKDVIAELNRTLEAKRSHVIQRAEDEIRQKVKAQSALDTYAVQLHKKRGVINKSLYQLFELYSKERKYPEYSIHISKINEKNEDYFHRADSLLEQYEKYIPTIGQNYRSNVWYGFKNLDLTFDDKNQVKEDLETLLHGYGSLHNSTKRIIEKYEVDELDYTDTIKWKEFLGFLSDSDVLTPDLMSLDACRKAEDSFKELSKISEEILPYEEKVLKKYSERIFTDIDGNDFYKRLITQHKSFFGRLFSSEYKQLVSELQFLQNNGIKPGYQEAVEDCKALAKYQELFAAFEAIVKDSKGMLGSCYNGIHSDWNHILAQVEKLKNYYAKGISSFEKMDTSVFSANRDTFSDDVSELEEEIQAVDAAKERLGQQFDKDVFDLEKDSYSLCLSRMENCLKEFDKLNNWIMFAKLLKELESIGLGDYIDTAIAEKISADDICGVFRRAFYKQWIEYDLYSVPELNSFSRINQDQAVQQFIQKDELQYGISIAQIKAELSSKRPNLDMVAGGSAVAVLRREGQKKRKQMPIRKLMQETGELVQIIKPCFLMSPLSVSAFLDPKVIHFDTVIFDEASQIFPEDAIGAIYRGSQLIVVGDSKQMPPSNFFNSSVENDEEDEEIGDINDYESILDICSSVFNTERLSWHYRSHYEQLIAFSNMHFYNNTLITFPSSSKDHKGIGVDYYYAGGTFDRKSKTNRKEAEMIVNLIYNHIKEHPDRSLGVVAFSVAQQKLIDALLNKRRLDDPSKEWFFRGDTAEPFFIKNLETVQGDERDTIIFSVAYARDSRGVFIQNFGPLNRVGGERRLNVAVTRAKDNVQLVASIHYTDINLSNTGSEGVRLLRAYLDYAENGEQALERALTVPQEDHYDSYFEEEVCEFLRDNGYTVDTQVGCSGYRIDLGVRRKDSSQYVLAVECDGATYHNSKNARDRDRLRQQVLENMGWKFYRIWSTDWYKNKRVEKERLLMAVRNAFSADKNNKAVKIKRSNTEEKIKTKAETFSETVEPKQSQFKKYKEVDALRVIANHPGDFSGALREILETEAPLSKDYLLKRIVRFFGREKVTNVVEDDFGRRLAFCKSKGITMKNGFLYLQGKTTEFRVPGDKREIKYISNEELALGFYKIIEESISVTPDGLYKAMTNTLGFNRTGEAISKQYNKVLADMLKDKLIKYDKNSNVISLN